MMVQTEIGLLPEDWEVVQIGDVGTNYSYGVSAESVMYDGINKYLRITDIDDNTHKFAPSPLVSPSFFSENHILQNNEIVVARTGASVGKSYIYDENDGKLVYAGFLMKFRVLDENAKYVFYQLTTNRYQNWVVMNSVRSGQPGLNLVQLKEFSFPLPKETIEQQNIASALSSIDKLIDDLGRTVSKKQLIREGAMEELLSGKKRLPGFKKNWGTCKFENLYRYAKEGGTPSTAISEYYANATIPFAKIEDLSQHYLSRTESFISQLGLDHSSAWLVPKGAILLSNGATLGEVSITNLPLATKQGILGIILKDDCYVDFIYYLLKSNSFKREMESVTTHGTMDCAYIKDLKNIELYIPSDIKEQQAIADILTSMDDEISVLQTEKAKYELIRAGMMEELLTGAKRLK